MVSQAYVAASSLLDTVVGPVTDAVSHAASAVATAASSSLSTATEPSNTPAPSSTSAASSTASTPSLTPAVSTPLPPLSIPTSSTFSVQQPFSPALSPSTVLPALRRTLSLAARQISLTLRPGYRNRFLVAVDGDSSTSSSALNHPHSPIQRMSLTADESHLKLLFQCLRHNLQARRRKSFSSLKSPPSTPPSSSQSPTSAPSTPTNRAVAPSAAVTQSAGKAVVKESFAERQARKKKRRERKERELQHRREVQQAREEVYVEGQSEILPLAFLQRLIRQSPARYHLSVWSCVYSMTVHGVSFDNLLSSMADKPCGLLLIQDMQGQRFGGYVSNPFISNAQATNAYYGTGECWVWQVRQKTEEERSWDERDHVNQTDLTPLPPLPSTTTSATVVSPPPPTASDGVTASVDETVAVYRWSGLNDYFMFTGAEPSFVAMGGGGAFAWRLDGSLRFGTSGECSTYQSPSLAGKKQFEAILVEVWAPVRGKF